MKKSLVLMAMAGVALAGCVNDVADLQQQEQKKTIIGFDSPVMYGNADSRANVYGEIGNVVVDGVTYSYPQEEDFIIYAVGHEGDFTGWNDTEVTDFNGAALEYDNNVNGWAPMHGSSYYYWTEGKKMTYAATSPADLEQAHWAGVDKRSYGSTGLTIEDFEVSSDPATQYDLLFSTRYANATSANMNHGANGYSGLPILFQHALSSIRFSVSNKSVEEVILTGITLGGVNYKGTFKENITEKAELYYCEEGVDCDNNIYYMKVIVDSTNNNPNKNEQQDELVAAPYAAFTGSVKFLEEPRYVSQLAAAGTGNTCYQLLLMPQALPEEAYVEVNYTVNGKANSKNVKLKGLYTTVQKTTGDKVEEVQGEQINSWGIGKRYTYRLFYSSESADKDKIYFAPETEAWDDVNVIVVPL